jgi:uncharacterized protein (TIGR02444 family)
MRDDDRRARQAAESLWRFSLALNARPGVAAALLRLQDRAGCDVNLILFALWLGATRAGTLDAAGQVAAAAVIAPLNAAIVHPLRQRRRELKGALYSDFQALRRRILDLELAAERQVQHRLAATLPDSRAAPGPPLASAEANLALCLGREAKSAEADVLRQAVAALMRLCGA